MMWNPLWRESGVVKCHSKHRLLPIRRQGKGKNELLPIQELHKDNKCDLSGTRVNLLIILEENSAEGDT